MSSLKPGDQVLYVPHDCHHMDTDKRGNWLFRFVHCKSDVHGEKFVGKPVLSLQEVGVPHGRNEAGHILTVGGHCFTHDGPLYFWPAKVISIKGDKVELEIPHPHGHTLYYIVPYDPAKKPHTCHLAEGA